MMFSPTKQSRSKTAKRNHSEFEQFSSGEIADGVNRMSVHKQQKYARKLAQDFVKSESNRSPSLTLQQPHGESIRFMDFLVQTTVDKHSKNPGVLAAAKKYSELPNTPTARANGLREFEIECQPHIEQELTVNAGFDLANATSNICNQMALLRQGTEFGRFAQGLGAMTQVAQGVYQITQASALMGQATSGLAAMTSGAMMLGAAGAVIAAGYMMYSLCSEEEDSGNGLGEALQAIHSAILEMHQEMRERFQHLEELIQENMGVVLTRLQEMNAKLDRLERIMSISFKEVQMKPLVDAIYSIQRDFKYKHLTDEERNHLVEELGSWLENHVKSTIQTSVSRDSDDLATCVEIMSSPDFDSAAMFPYLMRQFTKENLLPRHLLPAKLWTQTFSNLELQRAVVEIYCLAVVQYKMADNCRVAPIQNTLKSIQQTEEVLTELRDNPQVWTLLIRQYHHFRYQVGRAIAKCYADIPSGHADSTPLQFMLVTGEKQERLMDALNQMEFRRLLLVRLQQLTGLGDDEVLLSIQSLESKKDILQKPKRDFEAANSQLLDSLEPGGYTRFKNSLLNGANLNQWGAMAGWASKWGQVIHYICSGINKKNEEFGGSREHKLHLLFMSGNELEYSNGTKENYGTWGDNVPPIQWILNCCNFQLALLWIANGYELVESTAHFLNGYRWADDNQWNAIVQKYLVKEFNTKKVALYNAYQYYQAFESGFAITPPIDLDANCLLWLACTLGNIEVLESVPFENFDINQSIPSCNFTPLMMAVFCGKEKIVKWLLEHNAELDIDFTTIDNYRRRGSALSDENKPHLHYLAIESKQFVIANQLIAAGLIPTEQQRLAIENGLSALIEAPITSESKELRPTYQNETSTLKLVDIMSENLIKTKMWLLQQQAVPLEEELHHGMMLLSAYHQQMNDVLQRLRPLLHQTKSLITMEAISEDELEEIESALHTLDTQFTYAVDATKDLSDNLDADYTPPKPHQYSMPLPHPLTESKKGFISRRLEEETQCTELPFSETVSLLEHITSQNLTLEQRNLAGGILFLGRTGVGKTSVVNECLGAGYHKEQTGSKKFRLVAQHREVFKVGHSSKSETFLPGIAPYGESHYIVDMPGYDDNRGKSQKIANVIAMQWVQFCFNTIAGLVLTCDERDFYDSKFTPIRTSFEQVGRLLEPYSGEGSPLMLAINKSRGDEDLESITEKLNTWESELGDSIEDQMIKRTLSFLRRSPESILFVDVLDKASQATFEQRLKALTSIKVKAFNFSPVSIEMELFNKILRTILRAKQEMEQDIHDLTYSLAKQLRATLRSQSMEMPASLEQLHEKLKISMSLMGEDASDNLVEFTQLLNQQKDFIFWFNEIRKRFSTALNIKNTASVLHQSDFMADELMEKYNELKIHQTLFERLSALDRALHPSEESGYETDDDARDLLEEDTKAFLNVHRITLIDDEHDEFDDETSEQSMWIKPDETPGLRILRPAYHAVGNSSGFLKFFNDKGYTVSQMDEDVSIRLNIALPTKK